MTRWSPALCTGPGTTELRLPVVSAPTLAPDTLVTTDY